MRTGCMRLLVIAAAACLLAGCNTAGSLLSQAADANGDASQGEAATALASADGVPPYGVVATADGLLGSDPNDELSLGKKMYRANNFGLAEQHFRKATELHPRDAEAWLGLAASYDRLRRFDLADRAYSQVLKLIGPTPEVLNNQGYSYMLRGDYRRARATLLAAKSKSPENPYIRNNLELLAESERKAKTVN